MTEFTDKDRILLTRHDVKLGRVCSDMKELKKELKEGFKTIFEKLDANIVNCSVNRTECQREFDGKIKDIDEKTGKFFTRTVLMWILGILIFGVISIGSFTGAVAIMSNVNKQRILDFHKGETIRNDLGTSNKTTSSRREF